MIARIDGLPTAPGLNEFHQGRRVKQRKAKKARPKK
jgi:hypothetical protein